MPDNDLISRKALGISRCNPDVFNNRAYGEGWNACIAIIEAAPAVDAAPVVHGRWIEDRTDIVCSVCGARYKDEIVFMPDAYVNGKRYDGLEHCPHCGVRMKGSELNDT